MMRRLAPVLVCLGALSAATSAAAETIRTYITSGTGFFVNNDGYFVTNNHVVQNCLRIMIDGAVSTREAKLVATDKDDDLALLKTDAMGLDVGDFRDMRRPIQMGERVVLVGYPGDAYRSGEPVTREASIVSPTGPQGEGKWVQLSDVVQQGNSGGPLFDSTGNVVGVVTAKALIYTYKENDPENGTTSRAGIAISVPTVESFLEQAGIRYRTSMAEGLLSADSITGHAKRMIINVRCEYRTEQVR